MATPRQPIPRPEPARPISPARELARWVLSEVVARLGDDDGHEWWAGEPGEPGVIYLEVRLPPDYPATIDVSTAAGRVMIRIAG